MGSQTFAVIRVFLSATLLGNSHQNVGMCQIHRMNMILGCQV